MFSQEEEILLQKWMAVAVRQYHLPNPDNIVKFAISLLKQESDDPYSACYHELEPLMKNSTEDFLNNVFQALEDGSYRSLSDEPFHEEESIQRQDSISSHAGGSPTVSDGEDSYERRQRFRRRGSDASEPETHRASAPSTTSTNRIRALQSSRDEPEGHQRDNRRSNPHRQQNDNGNNRRNNNYSQQQGWQQNKNSTHYNQQPVMNSSYTAPYPGYPPQYIPYNNPYPYDPMAQGGYYPPPMGYPSGTEGWPQSAAPYSYPPANATAGQANVSGYYYGSGYGAPASSTNSYGYGANASIPKSVDTDPKPVDVSNTDEVAGVEKGTMETPADNSTSVTSTATAGYPSSNPTNYSTMYPAYSSSSHGYAPNPAQHRRQMQPPRESNKANRPAVKSLPEHERCTLRCTSIPMHITEEDLKAHFESFGHVVELQVSPMENQNADEDDGNEDSKKKKKACNECLVQFYSAANARRCLSSEVPVLNNRFIFIYQSHFNIVPPQDVPRPSRDILDRDAYLLQQKEIIPAASAAQAAGSRKRTALNMYATGMTNKWRRSDKDDGTGPLKVPAESSVSETASTGETSNDGEKKNENESLEPVATQSAASKAAADEMKQSLLRQKQLKQQAEDLLKKKEDVLISQIEKCRTMMEKLEKAPDTESKGKNLQYLEDKIVDLQSQLRAVREQVHQQTAAQAMGLASGNVGDKPSPSGKSPGGFFRGGGGYGYGGRFVPGRGGRGGRSWMPSARGGGGGRFGGGRFPRPFLPTQVSSTNPFVAKTQGGAEALSNGGENENTAVGTVEAPVHANYEESYEGDDNTDWNNATEDK